LHTGEVEMRGEGITGGSLCISGSACRRKRIREILVSRTVVDLVAGSGIRFADRGSRPLKGVPGQWQLFAVDLTREAAS
jgi:class 3 adenylate cyclase